MHHNTLIVLQPTTFCNIDCSYCYLPNRSIRAKMTVAVARAALERAMSSAIVKDPITFLWHLGEPLARGRDFYEEVFGICDELAGIHGRSYSNAFQTNGTLIDDRWAELIKRHAVSVGISIDGPKHLHDAQRRTRASAGTWERVMAGIRCLQANHVPFSTISVISAASLDYPDELIDFFEANGIEEIAFNIDEKEGVNLVSSYQDPAVNQRYRRFLAHIVERLDRTKSNVRLREVWVMARAMMLGSESPQNTTNAPFRIINILSNGDFTTYCPELATAPAVSGRSFVLGNVLTTSFDEANAASTLASIRREIEAGIEACRNSCEYFSVCGGGAPSNKFFETGRLDVSETSCCSIQIKATADVVAAHLQAKLLQDNGVTSKAIETLAQRTLGG